MTAQSLATTITATPGVALAQAPSQVTSDLESLRLPEHFVRELSAVSYDDVELLDARGGRSLHAIISLAIGLAAGMATCGVLVPKAGYLSAALVTLLICSVIAAAAEAVGVVLLFGLAALAIFAVLLHVVVTAHGGALSLSGAVFVFAGAVSYRIARAVRARRRRKRGLDVLARLHTNASQFNKLLTSLDVKDRLLAAQGACVDTAARANVVASLTTARENVVRTLKVERILRENRALLDDVGGASVELVPLETVRVHSEADEYARVVQQTAELAVGVQAAFDELQRQ
ncbi:MAG: hypothetical protein U0610_33485, partial [bacterium]